MINRPSTRKNSTFAVVAVLVSLLGSARWAICPAYAARPAWPGPSLLASVRVDSIEKAQIWIFPNADPGQFMLESAGLFEVLRELVRPELLAEIAARQVSGSPVLPASSLNASGIEVKFNEESLDLMLNIRPEARATTDISLRERPDSNRNLKLLEPAAFSGYVNLRASEGFASEDGARSAGRSPFLGSFEPVARLGDFVLESGADYIEAAPFEWVRRDTRLVRDIPSAMLRITAGDLSGRVTGYQVSRPQGGLSVAREFSIDPYQITHPISHSQVLLQRPSTVEVFLNGAFFTRLRLPPGPVDLRDFPFVAGVNSVELRITDDLGRSETVALSHVTDFDLLAPGLSQFSYSVGAPSVSRGLERDYESEHTTLTALHRVGVTERITLGANAQGESRHQLGGFEAGYLSRIGFWNGDAAASFLPGSGQGAAFRLFYRSLDRVGETELPARINLGAEHRTPGFAQLGTRVPYNPYGWTLDAYASRTLPAAIALGLGYQRGFNRLGGPDRVVVRTDLSRSFGRAIRAGANYAWTSAGAAQVGEHRVFLSLSWSDPVEPYGANLNVDTLTGLARADFYRNPTKPYDDYRLSAGVETGEQGRAADAQGEWLGHRGSARLAHRSDSMGTTRQARHATDLSLGTAVAWAGGAVAITRPISDSFAMIDVEGRPSGVSLPVNFNGEFAETEVNGRGPGVLSGMASYYLQPIAIDDSRLDMNVSVDTTYVVAKPAYRSGIRIPVRIRSVVHVQGVLVGPGGAPIQLQSGEARVIGSEDGAVPFFSNRKGEFFIEGLKKGQVEIRLNDERWRPFMIELKGDVAGTTRVGKLRVEPAKTNEGGKR